jgi:ubiquinol-cytochrome c reductase iron-sulfur subunit
VTATSRDDWVEETRPLNRRAYLAAVVSLTVAVVGGLVAAYGYWSDSTETVLGIGLAAALVGIGAGLVSWAKYLDLDEHAVQQRERLRTTPDELRDLEGATDVSLLTGPGAGSDGDGIGGTPVGRRRLLVGLFAGSVASLAIGFVGPIGSLGPKPRGERGRTAWFPGARLVSVEGTPIDAESSAFDQLATVFPESGIGDDDAQVVLLRVQPDLLTERTREGSVAGWVAYSKICTHAGCSVGLFGIDAREPEVLRQLVCPCHQSVFDPVDAAQPVGGPAPRPLPQLPLAIDDEGFLVARADFDRPVGPITWDEG